MAFRSAQVSVGTSPTVLFTATAGDVDAWVEVVSSTGADSIFLGDATVSSGTGFRLENADNVFNLKVRPGDVLYAVASVTRSVHVLIRSA